MMPTAALLKLPLGAGVKRRATARKRAGQSFKTNKVTEVDGVEITSYAARCPRIVKGGDPHAASESQSIQDCFMKNVTILQINPQANFAVEAWLKSWLKRNPGSSAASCAAVKKPTAFTSLVEESFPYDLKDYSRLNRVPKFWLSAFLCQCKVLTESELERMDEANSDGIRSSVGFLCALEFDEVIPQEVRGWETLGKVLLYCMDQAGRVETFQNAVQRHGVPVNWLHEGPYTLEFDDEGRLTYVTYKKTNTRKPGPTDIVVRVDKRWDVVHAAHDFGAGVQKGEGKTMLSWKFCEAFSEDEGPYLLRPAKFKPQIETTGGYMKAKFDEAVQDEKGAEQADQGGSGTRMMKEHIERFKLRVGERNAAGMRSRRPAKLKHPRLIQLGDLPTPEKQPQCRLEEGQGGEDAMMVA
jgi:hypothetical protein